MVFWWLIEILFTAALHFISIEIPNDTQINNELYTFSNFVNQETNFIIWLQKYMQAFHCMQYVIFVTAVAIKLFAKQVVETMSLNVYFKKHNYNIHDMFNVLIKNNEQFDQNVQYMTFFKYFS